jgi:hypothetical protein
MRRKSRKMDELGQLRQLHFGPAACLDMRATWEARRILETAMAAAIMAEMAEVRLARLESDVAHIRSDIADVKIDIRDIRKDLGGLHAEVGGLRDEMRTEVGGLRDEMRTEVGGLRVEICGLREEMRKELGELGKALVHGDLMTRIWMLLLVGVILGVMARGFHWI